MTAAAIISPKGSCLETLPENKEMVTGTVRDAESIEVNVNANKYSFQAAIKDKRPVVARAGAINGNKIILKD